MKFNPEKPVQTRDGRKARIICTDMRGTYSIVALIDDCEKGEDPHMFTACGMFGHEQKHPMDLINIPETGWAVLYDDGTWINCDDEKNAQDYVDKGRIACIEFTEEEGL